MKQRYHKPEIEIILLTGDDLMTGIQVSGETTPEESDSKKYTGNSKFPWEEKAWQD